MNIQMVRIPSRIWIEMHDAIERDSCDVIVEMEDGSYYSALFVTVPYLQRQMELTFDVSQQIPDTPAIRYAAMDTPHVLVENLERDTIEDAIDNLLVLDTFETIFNLVLDEDEDEDARARTAEVAAVVLTEVLRAEDETVA